MPAGSVLKCVVQISPSTYMHWKAWYSYVKFTTKQNYDLLFEDIILVYDHYLFVFYFLIMRTTV